MASNRDDPLSFMNPSSPIQVSNGDGYLVEATNSQIGSASGSFQNEGLLAGDGGSGNNSDVDFGFLRQELGQSSLVGTVKIYDRHVFLCYKNPRVWPPRVEAAEFDRLPRLLSAALLARKGEMKKQVRILFISYLLHLFISGSGFTFFCCFCELFFNCFGVSGGFW